MGLALIMCCISGCICIWALQRQETSKFMLLLVHDLTLAFTSLPSDDH